MSRAQELLRTTPQCVLTIVCSCSLVYFWQITYQPVVQHFTMCPKAILSRHQYYRLVTSPFLHGSIFHILMNMMSYLTLGSLLERSFGTMWHFTTIAFSACMVNITYTFLAFILYQCGFTLGSYNGHSLGFSGVLFHLLVIQCAMNSSYTHSVFGLFQVSSKMYPWVLLVMIQLIMPNVSFMGHLSGIVVGQLHISGYFSKIVPSCHLLRCMDEWSVVQRILMTNQDNYIKTPFSDELFDVTFARRVTSSWSSSSSSSSSTSMISNGSSIVTTYCTVIGKSVKGLCQTLKVKIFGRGRGMNENIRLNETEMNSLLLGVGDIDDFGEEENWIGLEQQEEQDQNQSEYKSELV